MPDTGAPRLLQASSRLQQGNGATESWSSRREPSSSSTEGGRRGTSELLEMAWPLASPEARTAAARRGTLSAAARRTSPAPGAAAISCNGWSGPASRLGWTEKCYQISHVIRSLEPKKQLNTASTYIYYICIQPFVCVYQSNLLVI